MKADIDSMAEILPKANAAGMRLVLGDDYGAIFFPHGAYAEELAFYVRRDRHPRPGRDPVGHQTRCRADGAGRRARHLAAGKLADLLVVDGNPLADVAVLRDRSHLLAIIKGGRTGQGRTGPPTRPLTGRRIPPRAIVRVLDRRMFVHLVCSIKIGSAEPDRRRLTHGERRGQRNVGGRTDGWSPRRGRDDRVGPAAGWTGPERRPTGGPGAPAPGRSSWTRSSI